MVKNIFRLKAFVVGPFGGWVKMGVRFIWVESVTRPIFATRFEKSVVLLKAENDPRDKKISKKILLNSLKHLPLHSQSNGTVR
jgi:hypothetical protein